MGWNGRSQPPSAIISIITIINYVPAYLKIHHITLVSCRAVSGGGISSAGNTVYSVLTSLAFQFFGNWVGVPLGQQAWPATYDLVKSGALELTQGQRHKITYYFSHRDESIIYNTKEVVETDSTGGPSANSYLCQIALDTDTPTSQCEDVYADGYMTRWGFYKDQTHANKMIADREYRLEQNLKIQNMAPIHKLQLTDDLTEGIRDEEDSSDCEGEIPGDPSNLQI